MPDEFVWLVYTQLQEALTFLRQCDPPIAHGDVHLGNVLLGYETTEGACLPQVKLIDFGASQHRPSAGSSSGEFDVEAWQLLKILEKLLRRAEAICDLCSFNGYFVTDSDGRACPSKRCRFHQKIADQLAPTKTCDSTVLDKLWKRFGLYAQRKVESCPAESKAHIRAVILEVTLASRIVVDNRIQEIMTGAKKAANSSCWPQ